MTGYLNYNRAIEINNGSIKSVSTNIVINADSDRELEQIVRESKEIVLTIERNLLKRDKGEFGYFLSGR